MTELKTVPNRRAEVTALAMLAIVALYVFLPLVVSHYGWSAAPLALPLMVLLTAVYALFILGPLFRWGEHLENVLLYAAVCHLLILVWAYDALGQMIDGSWPAFIAALLLSIRLFIYCLQFAGSVTQKNVQET